MTLREQFREGVREARTFLGVLDAIARRGQDLAAQELRVVAPAATPGTGGGGGGAAPPPAPGLPQPFVPGAGTPGEGVVFSSSSQGGGRGTTTTYDPWVRSYAPDNSYTAKLSAIRTGEPTTVGLLRGTAPGWIFSNYIFIDPEGAPGAVASRSSSHGAGGGASGGSPSRLVPTITGGPDGGAQTGQRRVRSGSTVTPGEEAIVGELRRISSKLDGDGGAELRFRGLR